MQNKLLIFGELAEELFFGIAVRLIVIRREP